MGTFSILDKAITKLKTVNGWIVIPKDFADYGTDYTTRAGIALVGLGGIRPPDVVYPTAFEDGDGKAIRWCPSLPLCISKRARLHLRNATWSLAIYDPQGFYVPNSIYRQAVFPRGCLCNSIPMARSIYIQANSPGAGTESNWLPAPANGPFNLTVRNYWPTEAVLDGTYKLPPVKIACIECLKSTIGVPRKGKFEAII